MTKGKTYIMILLFILPSMIIMFGVIIYPLMYSLYISFHRFSLGLMKLGTPYVGLDNYREMLSNPHFWYSLKITLYFTGVSIGLELVLGFLIAFILNVPFKGRSFLEAIIIIPWSVPAVINGILWKWIYNGSYGALNGILLQLGLIDSYKVWLGTPLSALNCIVIADVWSMTPFVAIVIWAGLQSIDSPIYEAAKVDGAGPLSSFFYITLPLLKATLLFVLAIRIMEAFRVFDIVYVLTSGGPGGGTQTLSYYVYISSFKFLKFGYGAAVSYIITAFIAVWSVILLLSFRKK